jgi:hypothetical protein
LDDGGTRVLDDVGQDRGSSDVASRKAPLLREAELEMRADLMPCRWPSPCWPERQSSLPLPVRRIVAGWTRCRMRPAFRAGRQWGR